MLLSSCATINRPGLQALEKALENKEIDAVAVDDLSRLSRSNHQMLTMVLKFHYHQAKIISVSDGIITDDDNAKLGIHIRGFINELYLDDLRKKTMRGLEGQKLRGFSAGENVYGYRTQPVGELKTAGTAQRSYVHTHPTHLFAGLLRCKSCSGAIVLMSGKGGGYYGCYNGGRKSCDNRLLVPKRRVEEIIISDLQNKLLTVENLEYIYKKVEALVSKNLDGVPEELKKKRLQHEKLASEIRHYLDYVKVGNFSKAVSDALKEAEAKSEELKVEMGSLEFQKKDSFKAPPKEWISHRLERLRETLNKNTTASALALKELLEEIRLEAVMEKELRSEDIINGDSPNHHEKDALGQSPFKPYYIAHTKIQTLALLDEEHKGSNWYCWRRR